VLLFDIGSASYKLDEWKHDFWNVTNIGMNFTLKLIVFTLKMIFTFILKCI